MLPSKDPLICAIFEQHLRANIKLQRTLENAQRIAGDLDALEQRFRFGFGQLRNDLGEW